MYTHPNHQMSRAVGVFSKGSDAELALAELRNSNFPMDRVSVIVKDRDGDPHVAGVKTTEEYGNQADEGAKTGAAAGGALGTLTGLLVGLGTLAIPGIGPIMLAGATATTLATTVAGGAIGAAAGGILGGLVGLGIPEERARVYSDRVSRGDYLVIVDGTPEEIRRAEAILSNRGIEEWGIYDRPDALVGTSHRAVGVFRHRSDADAALEALQRVNFPMAQVSLVARDYPPSTRVPHLVVRDRFDDMDFGFTEDRRRLFRESFDRGEYLVVVCGTPEQIHDAEVILNRQGIQAFSIYEPF
ncbi:MAG: hypothetical protein D6728_13365 [Cyanobacteria bacterium J055]|nr:MAG: hypothetical protein D6728_13365 [Cyanobacteria bacterium J055]